MSSSDRTRGSSPPLAGGPPTLHGGTPEAPESAPAAGSQGGQDPYGNWLDRMQRARARHAAITRNLHTWSNYKSWAERVKDSWDAEQKK
ncbi:MAG: hypothetical protein ACREUT_16710 [Steroidobacteraceae bacterium]